MKRPTSLRGLVRLALFTGTEPFRGLSASHFRDVVDVWEWEETEAPSLRQAKRPIALLAVKMGCTNATKKAGIQVPHEPPYWSLFS